MLGRNGNTAYVRYDSQGRIVAGGPIISPVRPKNGNWIAVSNVLGTNTTGTNGNILRAFIRLDMFGRVVPSSLVIQTKEPLDANSGTGWIELNAIYRGSGTTTTTTSSTSSTSTTSTTSSSTSTTTSTTTTIAPLPSSFVATITTRTDNYNVLFPYNSLYNYNGTINWGDGTVEAHNYNSNHTYAVAGNYTIVIDGEIGYWNTANTTGHDGTIIGSVLTEVLQFGNQFSFGDGTLGYYFWSCAYLVNVSTDIPTSGLTSTTAMFFNCFNFVGDNLSNWDVSNVTDMYQMFAFIGSTFVGTGIGNWNVSSVTNMGSMFYDATSFNQSLNSWNVSNVVDFAYMFGNNTLFNGNISSWNVSSAYTFSQMFQNCINFNQNLSGWDVSSCQDMSQMFYNARAFNQPIESWNVSNVTNFYYTFYNARAFNQSLYSWYVSSATNMTSMFRQALVFNQDLSNWCVTNFPTKPSNFDLSTPAWVLPKPVWGTCPPPVTTTTTTSTSTSSTTTTTTTLTPGVVIYGGIDGGAFSCSPPFPVTVTTNPGATGICDAIYLDGDFSTTPYTEGFTVSYHGNGESVYRRGTIINGLTRLYMGDPALPYVPQCTACP